MKIIEINGKVEVLDEHPYGWWIDTEGKLIRVQEFQEHKIIAAKLLGVDFENASEDALSRGWIRLINGVRLTISVFRVPNSKQIRTLTELSNGNFIEFIVDATDTTRQNQRMRPNHIYEITDSLKKAIAFIRRLFAS